MTNTRTNVAIALVVVAILCSDGTASAQTVTVSPNDFQIDLGGEFDAVVIPPGLKMQCWAGRVLASNDYARFDLSLVGGSNAVVIGRDFNGANPIAAKFDAPPNPEYREFGSNDHDLVSLPDGTILFLIAGFLKLPISPKPAWFDNTFRDGFGKGARTAISVWRSVDCGVSFQWVSDIDSADPAFDNGTCGLPEFRYDGPDIIDMQPWDMGGTDGPKAAVHVGGGSKGDVWLVHQCVGYFPKKDKPSEPDPDAPVNLALVFRSRDQGRSWEVAARRSPTNGRYEFWRGDLVLRGHAAVFTAGRTAGLWLEPFSEQTEPVMITDGLDPFPNQHFTMSDDLSKDLTNCTTPICKLRQQGMCRDSAGKLDPTQQCLHTNVLAHTVMAPIGSWNLVLSAYPSLIARAPGQMANGYFVYLIDVSTGSAVKLNPVLPKSGNEHESFVAFLTMARDGDGSALLYWYDVDAVSGQVSIRGRHVSPMTQTDDFDISRSGGASRSWAYGDGDFYGDYHEAEGFSFRLGNTLRHIYFPAWADKALNSHSGLQSQSRATQVVVDEAVTPSADVNEDGKVDCADLAIVRVSFGKKKDEAGFDARADVNGDGVVDIKDLTFVARQVSKDASCPNTPGPDLISVKSRGQPDNVLGFCTSYFGNTQTIIFSVENQGTASAPPFTTEVRFLPAGSFPGASILVPSSGSVAPGETRDFGPVAIPTGAFQPDVNFNIIISPVVGESNTGNNTAAGTCIG